MAHLPLRTDYTPQQRCVPDMGNRLADTTHQERKIPFQINEMFRLSGAPTRTRTADLLITNQLLYQLSYRGTGRSFRRLAQILQEEKWQIFCSFTHPPGTAIALRTLEKLSLTSCNWFYTRVPTTPKKIVC